MYYFLTLLMVRNVGSNVIHFHQTGHGKNPIQIYS